MQTAGAIDDAGWAARLEIAFGLAGGRTVVRRRMHVGPLQVQRAFHPEGDEVCHVYLLHPPGGIVAGDRLSVDVQVASGGHALVTTPAATKAYRSPREECTADQIQRLRVADGASLEWLPQETIVFDGARIKLDTRADLEDGGTFIGWEVLCLGRPAAGENFAAGHCRQRFELWRAGRPLCLERTRYDGADPALKARWGLAGAPVFGTMLCSPVPAVSLDDLRATAASDGDLASVTVLDGVLVCRYLGGRPARAHALFARLWSLVRPPLLGRASVPPRIWAT